MVWFGHYSTLYLHIIVVFDAKGQVPPIKVHISTILAFTNLYNLPAAGHHIAYTKVELYIHFKYHHFYYINIQLFSSVCRIIFRRTQYHSKQFRISIFYLKKNAKINREKHSILSTCSHNNIRRASDVYRVRCTPFTTSGCVQT